MKAYTDLLSNLQQNELILTVNRRLAQHLEKVHTELQTQPVWTTPRILPLQTWINQSWQNGNKQRRILLTDFEEQWIWQQIISRYGEHHPIIQIRNTAELAKQAWNLMHQWQLSVEDLERYANDETATYVEWQKAFRAKLNADNLVTTAELLITEPARQTDITKIYLVGFDDISPAVTARLNHYRAQRIEINFLSKGEITTEIRRISCDNLENELLTMAQWAEQQAQQHPNSTVACLIPNLAMIRHQVESAFNRVCSVPFNLSAGQPLSDYPVISDALNLLELNLEEIDFTLLSKCLMSIYHSETAADRCAAATIESELRLYPSNRLNAQNLLHECQRQAKKFNGCTFATRWQRFTELKQKITTEQHPTSHWIEPLQNILLEIGWPSTRPANSETYQVIQRWQNLWAEFIALDKISGELSYYAAVKLLKQLAMSTQFQQKSIPANIQVMGLLESSGIYFDKIWLAGLDDETWPPKAKPNPFIPYQLQRQFKMPHANSDRELAYCETLQQRLLSSCNSMIMSHALHEGDKHLNPSCLIKDYPLYHTDQLKLSKYISAAEKQIALNLPIETISDELAPPLQAEEITYGGSWIMQQQALCPFRAFAKVRLSAEAPGKTILGIDAAERGTLTHTVLELVWKGLKNQKALLNLDEAELAEYLNTKIDHAIKICEDLEIDYIDIEKSRLCKLLLQWLEHEKQRPDFEVLEQETDRFIQVGNLKLRIKIDRIDQLDNDSLLVIDYKTGQSNSLQPWFDETLTQPQLPLYSVYGITNASGISYAQINSANMQFTGIVAESSASLAFSKIKVTEKADPQKRTWQELNSAWKITLEKLSNEFVNGIAKVQPSIQACLYCDLHSFCRIGMSYE